MVWNSYKLVWQKVPDFQYFGKRTQQNLHRLYFVWQIVPGFILYRISIEFLLDISLAKGASFLHFF